MAGLKECDIIMKGGITSGVVFPEAVLKLAQSYRFRSIGGTSAGAIAAAVGAAAEYGRETKGFEKLSKIPEELGDQLSSMFQPDPRGAPLYEAFDALVLEKSKLRLLAIILFYPV